MKITALQDSWLMILVLLMKMGKKVEPDGNVKVTMEYKKDVIPEEVKGTEKDLGVTVMHLEENGKGQVKKVVDMGADAGSKASVETTDNGKVKKAEFVTDSFSTFTLCMAGI